MLHSYSKIWLHIIWSTKSKQRIIQGERRTLIYNFLIEKAIEIKVPIEVLNIQPEHIHLLIDLPTDISVSKFVKNLKGSSSRWINEKKLFKGHFEWQRGYGVFSVSPSLLIKVKTYIKNQDEHHKRMSYKNELNTLLKKTNSIK
ncbi:MAG TPA: IS200/IS605 family transposase [Candidatus Kapabacteria bacterium]|nr:IS200/IS605 family transposase [Candidatus Kapabacteria bacterium]